MSAYTVVVRDLVWEREAGACAACGNPITWEWSLQHRRARGMGGTLRIDSNQVQNLILMCGSGTTGCHGSTESHPAWATNKGYRVGQTRDPATVPVFIQGAGWVLLDSIGGYIPAKDPHPDETIALDAATQALGEIA